jgi:hypothetical protein
MYPEDGLIMDTSVKYIKMCESAKEIQRKWRFGSGDFVYDPDLIEVEVWTNYHVGDPTEYIWLPRQDQYQDICIDFFMRIMGFSEYEAFIHFLGSYASWLKEFHNIICYVGGGYQDVDSFEELMLEYTMEKLHEKKWGGEGWVKTVKGYKSSSNLCMGTQI